MYGLWPSFQIKKKWRLKNGSDFTVKLRGFGFFSLTFSRAYAKIIPNLLNSLEK